ncbi:MAG TPA: SUMF1/EgtB/PvdO family nonheme iron enzyme, partial [Polyangiaceae bacterium]|nr:SUMF1/EgtB/PvdO family nonheme iron enzyme [Polyangiaceae bacterium]
MAHRASLNTLRLASLFAGAASVAIVVQQALMEYAPPVRCAAGLVAQAGRCCGGGQTWFNGRCEGHVTSCGPNQFALEVDGEGRDCVFDVPPVELPGGHLPQGAADFQLEGVTGSLDIRPFAIDRGEVTVYRYNECIRREACSGPPPDREPGLPVTGISPQAAEAFCAFAGGRLPEAAEWRFAASGLQGRRFPWGFTGLVCRRASFGLLHGPCSDVGAGPDLVGARPDGNTPEGIADLS